MIEHILSIAREAGHRILDVYNNALDFEIEKKGDDSPLTLADRISHEYIVNQLQKLDPSIPVLSEEGKDIPYDERKKWDKFWCVDPLDGTKEFIKRNGEFTINIALIEGPQPVMGVIYVPVLDIMYFGQSGEFAYKIEQNGSRQEITVRKPDLNHLVAVQSRSHSTDAEKTLFEKLGVKDSISRGSSLKFCMVAEGKADIYFRSGPTMEWDTAAGHAILLGAGGLIFHNALTYNKPDLRNSGFIALSTVELAKRIEEIE
ncbi:MAG: 3'(2'),5'-bisphosphate nucleotidase [Methanobacteriota archaeon]|nr:MAG: 3'(2'),5'-bisphosphate nucleotidase [Euryarchaeota archaeon]